MASVVDIILSSEDLVFENRTQRCIQRNSVFSPTLYEQDIRCKNTHEILNRRQQYVFMLYEIQYNSEWILGIRFHTVSLWLVSNVVILLYSNGREKS